MQWWMRHSLQCQCLHSERIRAQQETATRRTRRQNQYEDTQARDANRRSNQRWFNNSKKRFEWYLRDIKVLHKMQSVVSHGIRHKCPDKRKRLLYKLNGVPRRSPTTVLTFSTSLTPYGRQSLQCKTNMNIRSKIIAPFKVRMYQSGVHPSLHQQTNNQDPTR